MKRIFAILFILLLCAISMFAQSESETGWKTLSPPNEEFTIDFPTEKFDETKFEIEGIFMSGTYRAFAGNTYFFVFSGKDKADLPLDLITKFASGNKAEEKNIVIGRVEGKKYTFKDAEDFYQTLFTFKTDKRFYIFQTVSENKSDAQTERFFESIQFNKTIPVQSPKIVEKKQEKPQTNNTAAKNNGGTGNGIGSGSGDGSGSGGGATNKDSAISENQTSSVKILTKPQPRYTDLARKYLITGTVQLRITFLADGTIGSVSPVKKLPFGLTTNAVSAAKQIRFEPAYKNGVPYAVVKTAVYTFIIY